MHLYFKGQFEGFKIKLPLQIRQCKLEPVDSEVQEFYSKLLGKVDEPIFHGGTWRLKEVSKDIGDTFENLIAYVWKLEGDLRLIVANLSRSPAQGYINFKDDVIETNDYAFSEIFSGQMFKNSGLLMTDPGLSFSLASYQAQIFDISRIE